MKILDQPSVFAAEIDLKFSEIRTIKELTEFFRKMILRLFEVSGIDDKIVGHIKIYSEGKNGSSIRANLTGNIKDLTVIFNGDGEETELKVWINVITFMVKKEELLKNVKDAIVAFFKNYKEIKEFSFDTFKICENH
ncbi:MAG: hypothetical protein QXL52_03195 [Nitrososphaerales archaeon]